MKHTLAIALGFALYATAQAQEPTTATVQRIEIKGLYIGMTLAELEKTIGSLPLRNFTIAGALSQFPIAAGSTITLHEEGKHFSCTNCASSPNQEDTLDSFLFAFDPKSFDEVKAAVNGKYPALVCKNSTVTNAMGGAFTQTSCTLFDKQGSLLQMQRYAGDTKSSSLTLTSKRVLNEQVEKRNARRKDL